MKPKQLWKILVASISCFPILQFPLVFPFSALSYLSLSLLLCFCSHFDSPSYLQSQSHSLGDGRLREDGLDMGHQLSGQPAALRTDQITLLLNAGDHSEVKGEVSGDDPANSLLLQLVLTLQVYRRKE